VPTVIAVDASVLAVALADDGFSVGRLVAEKAEPNAVARIAGRPGAAIARQIGQLSSCEAIVAPADKWVFLNGPWNPSVPHWPLALIDEAFQMRADNLFRMANFFDRALPVGDPGQLDPFTIADPRRFSGLATGPLETAAAVLATSYPDAPVIELPVTWRLPPSAAIVVRDCFYELAFDAATEPDERELALTRVDVGTRADDALTQMAATGWAYLELPARYTLRTDGELIEAIALLARRLLERQPQTRCERNPNGRPLTGQRIAIGTAHRDQADLIRLRLAELAAAAGPHALADITVDTANRLQGREFDVTIIWHPLAGRRDATAFHLEAGRLCVLLSRHRHGCIVVGRDGIGDLLDAYPTESRVQLNLPADIPDGWEANHAVLGHLLTHRV